MTDTVPLPPCDPAQCIPYQSIRYINGYAEGYVHQFARDYAAAVSAADNAALQAALLTACEAADRNADTAVAASKRAEELETLLTRSLAAMDEWHIAFTLREEIRAALLSQPKEPTT